MSALCLRSIDAPPVPTPRRRRDPPVRRPAFTHGCRCSRSFVGWLAVEIVDQGDEDLLDHLHHFPHTDTRSEHASTDDHTLSHRNGSISCKGYANRPGLERADSTATAKV